MKDLTHPKLRSRCEEVSSSKKRRGRDFGELTVNETEPHCARRHKTAMKQPPARLMPTRNTKAKATSPRHRKTPITGSLAKGTAIGISVMCLSLAPAFAGAILYWDGDGLGQVGGGAGTWDTTLARWSTTPDGIDQYQIWNNANNDDAVFGGVASNAVVPTASQPLTVNSITFTTNLYTLGSSTAPFFLNSASGTLTVDVQVTQAIINAQYNVALTTIVKNGTGLFSTGLTQSAGGFAGKWIVNGGILSLAGDGRVGVVPTDVVPDQITLNGGFLRSSQNPEFHERRGITLTAGGGGFDTNNTALLIWRGPISGIGGGTFTKRGTGNVVLTNDTNNYDGQTIVQAGRLTVSAANALGLSTVGTEVRTGAGVIFTGATSNFTIAEPFQLAGSGVGTDGGAISVQNGANVTFNGPITLVSDATIGVTGNSTAVFTNANAVASESGQSFTLAGDAVAPGGGIINGGVSLGVGSLVKQGPGQWTLAGLNVYTGLTTVQEGTLIVSGTINGTAQVDIAGFTSATLGGSGTIAPGFAGNVNLFAGGKIAPGVGGAGTLTLTLDGGVVDLSAGITEANSLALLFELLAPGTSDKVVVNGGAINIGEGLLGFGDFNFSTLPGFVGNGDYVLFDGSAPLIGLLGPNTTGTIGGLDASLMIVDGRDIVLHLVPEPSAAAALLGGAATLLGLRRRRNS